jgi:hypothetical protein
MAGFRSTGSLAAARSSFSAAWLDVGRVLVAGGSDNAGADLLTTEAFDPTTETWSAAGSLHNPHVLPPLVSTPTGAVLVGRDPFGVDALLETWDGQSGVWNSKIMPPYFSAADGAQFSTDRVEVLCGARAPLDPLGTGRFVAVTLADKKVHPLPTPAYDRSNPYTCVLADGRLLAVSGIGFAIGASGTGVEYLTRTAEVYDGATGTWTPTGRLAVSHRSFDRSNQCLVALPDGGALIVAGSDQIGTYTDVVERWSPSTGRWAQVAPLPDKRDGHTTTLLDSTTVLVVGGENANGVRADTYTYDLASDSWSPADTMNKPRTGHVAVLIPHGLLLVIDGASDGTCEIFD